MSARSFCSSQFDDSSPCGVSSSWSRMNPIEVSNSWQREGAVHKRQMFWGPETRQERDLQYQLFVSPSVPEPEPLFSKCLVPSLVEQFCDQQQMEINEAWSEPGWRDLAQNPIQKGFYITPMKFPLTPQQWELPRENDLYSEMPVFWAPLQTPFPTKTIPGQYPWW